MKIVAILESAPSVGGGFNQALNAVRQMRDLCAGRFDFQVLTTRMENLESLSRFGIVATSFSYSPIDSLLAVLTTNVWWQSIQSRLKLVGPFERQLIGLNCDLVYFVSPTEKSAALQKLNFLATVWDACHRDMPEFPEVRSFSNFYARERFFRDHLTTAIATLTDSEELADKIALRYGVDRDRLLPMPFSPAPFMDQDNPVNDQAVLDRYALERGYFFYPAQFWAHKNHIRILQALALLNEQATRLNVVFAGGNQGNRMHIERILRNRGLEQQVRFLDFVPAEHMPSLYRGCRAVLMPTYFGPTNLPPLEAWTYGVPLVYSRLFARQVGDAALLVDPDNASDLASAMSACLDDDRCAQLSSNGKVRLKQLGCERNAAENKLLEVIQRFELRLQCWRE